MKLGILRAEKFVSTLLIIIALFLLGSVLTKVIQTAEMRVNCYSHS